MQSYVIQLWSHRKPVAENKPNPASRPPCSRPSMTLCKQLGHLSLSAGACGSPQQYPSHPRLCKIQLNSHFYRCLSCPLLSDKKKGTKAKLATRMINVLPQEFGVNPCLPPCTGSPSPPLLCLLLYPADEPQPQSPGVPGLRNATRLGQ